MHSIVPRNVRDLRYGAGSRLSHQIPLHTNHIHCCFSQAWVQHRLLCKVTAGDQTNSDSKLLAASPMKRLAYVVSSPKKVTSPGRLLPRKPLDEDFQVWELAITRMRRYLTDRFRVHGRDFARWWHAMPDVGKKDVLKLITNNTFPAKSRSNARMAPVVKTGAPKYSACVLTEWCFERTLSQCKCEKHWYKDALLHEMHYHLKEDRAEDIDYQLCVSMVMQGYIPSSNEDEQIFLRLPNDSDPVQAHQFLHRRGTRHQGILSSIKKTGIVPPHLKEKLPFELFLHRNWYRFSLFCLLFEIFDGRMRRVPVDYPLERLRGCEYCRKGCEDDDSVLCQGCKETWWCCQGCCKVSTHAKECTLEKPLILKQGQTVLFA